VNRAKPLLVAAFLLPLIGTAPSCSRNAPPQGGADTPIPSGGGPVSWPTPLPTGTQSFTFRGDGNGTTEEFTLEGDAALRIVADKGPFKLRVRRADGKFLKDEADLPNGGQALMAIAKKGRYAIVVEGRGKWGVTVVHE
jgi:hypothetical protein